MKLANDPAPLPIQSSTTSAPKLNPNTEAQDLKRVAQEFEGLLMKQVFQAMRRTASPGGKALFSGGLSEDIFTDWLDSALAEGSARSGAMGEQSPLLQQLAGAHTQTAAIVAPDLSVGTHMALQAEGWVRPLDVQVKRLTPGQRFGATRAGARPQECGGGHCGVDVAVVTGSPVRAARAGIIKHVGTDAYSASGLWVAVEHDAGAVQTRYMHLSHIEPGIEPGAAITAGQPIGESGNTGKHSTGPHLHFEVLGSDARGKKVFIDTQALLEKWPSCESSSQVPYQVDDVLHRDAQEPPASKERGNPATSLEETL